MKENRTAWINGAKSWLELAKAFNKHNATFGELVLHPEATDAMILEAAHYRRDTAKRIRKSREAMIKNYYANKLNYDNGNSACRTLVSKLEATQL